MRNFLLGIILTLLACLGIFFFLEKRTTQATELKIQEVFQNHIQNVSKLIVSEGYFSEIITYKDAKSLYWDFFTAEKKAIVVANARATIAYDLHKITYELDSIHKTITITALPKAEVNIYPEIRYHDLEQDYLNPFTAADHNTIKSQILKQLQRKINASTFFSNSKNRLASELHKLFILTNTFDWKLVYKNNSIDEFQDIEPLIDTFQFQ